MSVIFLVLPIFHQTMPIVTCVAALIKVVAEAGEARPIKLLSMKLPSKMSLMELSECPSPVMQLGVLPSKIVLIFNAQMLICAQGTGPSKKITNIPDVKLCVVTLAGDGLLIVKDTPPFQPIHEHIAVPRAGIDGLLTATHFRSNHPSKHQLKQLTSRYFYTLDLAISLESTISACHQLFLIDFTPNLHHYRLTPSVYHLLHMSCIGTSNLYLSFEKWSLHSHLLRPLTLRSTLIFEMLCLLSALMFVHWVMAFTFVLTLRQASSLS